MSYEKLTQQLLLGKPLKKNKIYVNADFNNLCYMSDEEYQKDIQLRSKRLITDYFDETFKKEFKVHRHGDKLCFLRNGHYQPLLSGDYGYIVSPKGSLYAVHHINGKACSLEIKNKEFYNSLIRAGQPVQTAGFFKYDFAAGQISAIYRDSGHYKPTFEQHLNACIGLEKKGLVILQTRVGKFTYTQSGVNFALGDIINKRVDYSAIATNAEPHHAPPPPISNSFAESTEKMRDTKLSSTMETSAFQTNPGVLSARQENEVEVFIGNVADSFYSSELQKPTTRFSGLMHTCRQLFFGSANLAKPSQLPVLEKENDLSYIV